MAIPVALIQGASRGIGLQFCKTLLTGPKNNVVIATCRNPSSAQNLQILKDEHPKSLHIFPIDVTNESQIQQTASDISLQFKNLDLLINCAAILHPSGKGETSLRDVSSQGVLETLSINTVGPLLMAKYFSPLLLKGCGGFGKATENQQHKAVLVNMSAKVGSITDNGLGGWYSYRMAKAALNMATKNLSIELGRGKNKVICVSLHPGTVDTDLSKPYHKNVPKLFTPEYSVDCLLKVIESLEIDDSGKFFTYDRTQMQY
ncbi:hypothetical protein LOTGIDRAFT_131045 [Lottia gigantea]|uniref:Uncharacterized protein n=1 Tax=Lottia gigantea TaxID=225164 RepID=V3ZR63_LOTGI|nr:hypothetical protein LOTGIDRAFT_131045 [Lottia gigantea]ESO85045.1 hypothetical protein LOTGIDRAFT_131045 [Lottia gigantea]